MQLGWWRLWVIVALWLTACSKTDTPTPPTSQPVASTALPSTESSPSSQLFGFVVEDLPPEFPSQPLFSCSATGPDVGFFIGYRGLERRDSDVYQETPFLRMFAAPADATDQLWLDGLSGRGDDDEPVDVAGRPGVSFTVATVEPVLTPWPAIRWEQNGAVLQILGEGLEFEEVLAAAESVRVATVDEIESGGFFGGCE